MRQVVECIEPQRRPARRAVSVEDGERVGLYALAWTAGMQESLRRTVLRTDHDDPPPGAVWIAWFMVTTGGLVASEVSPAAVLELQRGSTRRQVVAGMRLPVQGLYEMTLAEGTRASFALHLQRDAGRGAMLGVSGSGTRASRVRDNQEESWWVLTKGTELASRAGQAARDWFVDRVKATGINEEVLTFFGGLLLSGAIVGWMAWNQYRNAQAAEAHAAELEGSLELAEAAQAASLSTEMSCLDDRQALVAELGRREEQRQLQAEEALQLPRSRQVSLALGGMRMASDPVRKLDALLQPGLVGAVQVRMATVPPQANADACAAQGRILGPDVPTYVLLWHPDAKLTCPLDYAAEEGGIRLIGRWGLSDRVAREFGGAGHRGTGTTPEAVAEVLDDPREEDRWSAFTLTAGYREVLQTLLKTRRTERPPVLPGQGHLWALALFDAYNRLPSPSGGVLDATASSCVDHAIEEIAGRAQPASPGSPLFPDIASVATRAVDVPLTPRPGCAWSRDALIRGAESALQAAARLAVTGASADAAWSATNPKGP